MSSAPAASEGRAVFDGGVEPRKVADDTRGATAGVGEGDAEEEEEDEDETAAPRDPADGGDDIDEPDSGHEGGRV